MHHYGVKQIDYRSFHYKIMKMTVELAKITH